MTQRNEEWAREESPHDADEACPQCPHRIVLTMEVIDESVRMLPEVLKGIEGEATSGLHHSEAVTLTYTEAVERIYKAGFRPIDLVTRAPNQNWQPRPPETKAARGRRR